MNSEFYTPPEVVGVIRATLGEIDLDPASHDYPQSWIKARRFYTATNDGWQREWRGRVMLNPPSGTGPGQRTMGDWWNRLVYDFEGGRVESAVFVAFHLVGFSGPMK